MIHKIWTAQLSLNNFCKCSLTIITISEINHELILEKLQNSINRSLSYEYINIKYEIIIGYTHFILTQSLQQFMRFDKNIQLCVQQVFLRSDIKAMKME